MKKTLFSGLMFCIVSLALQSQNFNNYYHQANAFFPMPPKYKPWAWFISPGLTHTVPTPGTQEKEYNQVPYTYNANGKLGFYLDAGMAKFFKYPGFFRYFDFGLNYKSFKGQETYFNPFVEGRGDFNDQYASAFINFNNIIEVSNPWFIQNAFGLNVDYRFSSLVVPSSGVGESFPSQYELNLHYKFSIGLMATKNLLIMPSIETPLLGVFSNVPWPYQKYFNSWYQPFIFSVRLLFLHASKEECPPVYAPGMMDGMTPDGMSK